MDVEVTRRQFTTDEYLRMIDAQIFDHADHVELIEGDVLEMAPVGPSHASCVAVLNRWLVVGVGDRGPGLPSDDAVLGLALGVRAGPHGASSQRRVVS